MREVRRADVVHIHDIHFMTGHDLRDGSAEQPPRHPPHARPHLPHSMGGGPEARS